jgi:hypothetical protein
MGPGHPNEGARGISLSIDRRSRVGLRPVTPHSDEGMRIDPAVLVPSVSGTLRVATAAADPPLDPPVSRCGSHGFAGRSAGGHVVGRAHGELVHVRLADDECPRGFQPRHELAVFGGNPVPEGLAAGGGVVSRDVHLLLDQHGDATQGKLRVVGQGAGGGQGLIGPPAARRVGHRLPLLDRLKRRGDQLDGGQQAVTDPLHNLGHAEGSENPGGRALAAGVR